MLDKKDLKTIKSEIDAFEKERDFVIKQSREIVKKSKTVIYSVHRNDLKQAAIALKEMNSQFKVLKTKTKNPKLRHSGSFKVAVQEYVEAVCFYELMKNGKIPTNDKLKLDADYYLLGLIDVTGELVRKAINASIEGDYKTSIKMKTVVSELYDELMLFDFANGELRKKFDSVKYDLKKLDDLALDLKLNNKV